jgi:hypothetical protein
MGDGVSEIKRPQPVQVRQKDPQEGNLPAEYATVPAVRPEFDQYS